MPDGKPDTVRPSAEDRCAEGGELVGHEWVCYRRDPADPQSLRWHFGGVVRARKVVEKPPIYPPRENVRDFRYPDDLDVFFHRACAPRVELPEKLKEELAGILAKALVEDMKRNPPEAD
jgi:hypothetical protein